MGKGTHNINMLEVYYKYVMSVNQAFFKQSSMLQICFKHASSMTDVFFNQASYASICFSYLVLTKALPFYTSLIQYTWHDPLSNLNKINETVSKVQ